MVRSVDDRCVKSDIDCMTATRLAAGRNSSPLNSGFCCDGRGVARMAVHAGAGRSAAEIELVEIGERRLNPFEVPADGPAPGGEFLAEPDGHRILQVCARRFQNPVEFLTFASNAPAGRRALK